MISAKDVALYILTSLGEQNGVSNLKLQKLLYYSQGVSLILLGGKIFYEDLLRWDHGPVVGEVYHEYKNYDRDEIPIPVNFNAEMLIAEERTTLDRVMSAYGSYTASELRNMTHNETPWLVTKPSMVISEELMRDCFEKIVLSGEIVPKAPPEIEDTSRFGIENELKEGYQARYQLDRELADEFFHAEEEAYLKFLKND